MLTRRTASHGSPTYAWHWSCLRYVERGLSLSDIPKGTPFKSPAIPKGNTNVQQRQAVGDPCDAVGIFKTPTFNIASVSEAYVDDPPEYLHAFQLAGIGVRKYRGKKEPLPAEKERELTLS